MIALIGMAAILVCYSIFLNPGRYKWAIIVAFLHLSIIVLSEGFLFALFSYPINSAELLIYGSKSFLRIAYLLVCKLTQLALYQVVLQVFEKEQIPDIKNGLLAAIITALGLGILMKYAARSGDPGTEIIIFALVIVFLLLNLILYLMIRQLRAILKNKYEMRLMQERMAFEKSRVDEASVIWRNIRQVKHDLKNHFAVLRGHLADGDVEACEKYVAKLDATVEGMGNMIQSGNTVIDYLINSKLSGLEGVEVLISGYVGHYNDIDDVDLACILGNVLDNATEALHRVEGEKRIELLFLRRKADRIIICKNTIKESVLSNNRRLKSTKASPELHGIGHQIVEATVKKYHGLIDYFEEDGMFGVQIMLPEDQSI
ncbi:MAG: ATP-binding protein [Clostridia bacterium]|nr:ATP-binding protein [Clostridia bacterium]